jgi:hypothetical protein
MFDRLTHLQTLFLHWIAKAVPIKEKPKNGLIQKVQGAEAGKKQQHVQQRQAMAGKYRPLRLLPKSNNRCCFLAGRLKTVFSFFAKHG